MEAVLKYLFSVLNGTFSILLCTCVDLGARPSGLSDYKRISLIRKPCNRIWYD